MVEQQRGQVEAIGRRGLVQGRAPGRQVLRLGGVGAVVQQEQGELQVAGLDGRGQGAAAGRVEAARGPGIGGQDGPDPIDVPHAADQGQIAAGAPVQQSTGDDPRVRDRILRQVAGAEPVVPVHGHLHGGAAVGAAGVDVGAQLVEAVHEVQLPGDGGPVEEVVAQSVGGPHQVRVGGQERLDPFPVAVPDRRRQRLEAPVVPEAGGHGLTQQAVDLAVAALGGDGQQLVPGVVGVARLAGVGAGLQQQLHDVGMALPDRHVDGKLVPVLGVDEVRVPAEEATRAGQAAGGAGAEQVPGVAAVHGHHAVDVALRVHGGGPGETDGSQAEGAVRGRSP